MCVAFSFGSEKEEGQGWLCRRICTLAGVQAADVQSLLQRDAEGKMVFEASSVTALFTAGEVGCRAARRDCGFAGDKNLGGKCGLNKAAALLLAGAPEISGQRSQDRGLSR